MKWKTPNQFGWIRLNVWSKTNISSSNIDRIYLHELENELVVVFKGGQSYTYYDVDYETFSLVAEGFGICKTEGSNQWGEWFIGKSPSYGAAFWEWIREEGYLYREGNRWGH